MPNQLLQSSEEIFEELRDSLTQKVTGITNFTNRSFNSIFTRAVSEEVRDLQELTLASELAGFIDYAGGPITESDLEELGIEGDISVDRVNELLTDEQLDELVKIVGVTRDGGDVATGVVTFTTATQPTTIPAGTVLSTSGTDGAERSEFVTDEEVSTAEGETVVRDVDIVSTVIGVDENVPANSITRIINPPTGVRSVTNPEATTGGEDVETNDELRERAKAAVGGASKGGTVEGIKNAIRTNVESVRQDDVLIDESLNTNPPFVDVIVDGGVEQDVKDVIESSRPTGIKHNIVRPQVVQIGASIDLVGSNIGTQDVENNIEEFLLESGIGENFFQDQIVREIMLSDDNILNIDDLGTVIERSTNEKFNFESGRSDYRLDYTYEDENGTILIEDDSNNTYTEGDNFSVVDVTNDGFPETIRWDLSQVTPNDGDEFRVDYDVTVPGVTKPDNEYDTNIIRDEEFTFSQRSDTFDFNNSTQSYPLTSTPLDGSVTLADANSTTFTRGKSFQLAPLGDNATEDTFTFDINTAEYTLSSDIEVGFVAITDSEKNIFVRDVDYQTIDVDNDGFDETVTWDIDISGAVADDGGTETDETTAANNDTSDDLTLLPSSPAVGDAYYFGFDEEFSGFDLNISTAGSGTWDIVWEYFNGTSFVPLSNVTDDTNSFRNSGRNSVEFENPADWAKTSVGGISGLYWVRGRLDSFSSVSTQPLGQEVEIGRKPDSSVDFTVNYDGFVDSVRWDQSGEDSVPPQDSTVTVTYTQQLYETELEIVETLSGIIRDSNGNTFEQDVAYETVDSTRDGEKDAIKWLSNPSNLNFDEEFFFSYVTEGDVIFTQREKVDPGTIEANQL
jgi:hypothetical protein